MRRSATAVVALLLLATLAPGSALAAGITVNSTNDTVAGDGDCTLREAITAANTDTASGAMSGECAAGSGADQITFLVAGTIVLSSALPSIASDVAIDGAGDITVSGASTFRIFDVAAASVVALSQLTMTSGSVVSPVGSGGAISNAGTLTVLDSTLSGNAAWFAGGAIFNSGTLTVSGSTINGNTAVGTGGGISNSGTVTITNSTISGNSAVNGGGIDNGGTATITDSTISGNSAANFGGGIENSGSAVTTITDSTISGNSTGNIGGGIDSDGTLTMSRSTISGNSAGNNSDGISTTGTADLSNVTIAGNAEDGIFSTGTLVLRNATITANGAIGLGALGSETVIGSIIAGNVFLDVAGPIETSTANLIGVPSGMTLADILDPAGLADHGGPTETVALALVAGNPAIDAGDSATCAAAPVSGVDQRGLPRPSACDIGAYEAQPPAVAAHANVSAAATSAAGAAVTFTPPAGTDEQGGAAAVACLPASGSTFAVGSTTVTCTATDAVGHTGSGTFAVIVGPFATPTPSATPAALPNTASGGSPEPLVPALALVIFGLGIALRIRERAIRRR